MCAIDNYAMRVMHTSKQNWFFLHICRTFRASIDEYKLTHIPYLYCENAFQSDIRHQHSQHHSSGSGSVSCFPIVSCSLTHPNWVFEFNHTIIDVYDNDDDDTHIHSEREREKVRGTEDLSSVHVQQTSTFQSLVSLVPMQLSAFKHTLHTSLYASARACTNTYWKSKQENPRTVGEYDI